MFHPRLPKVSLTTNGIPLTLQYISGCCVARHYSSMSPTPPSETDTQTKRKPQPISSLVKRRRRTIMACSNCRRRKIRCLTSEQPPRNPCTYCQRKRLDCEYLAVDYPDDFLSISPGNPAAVDLPKCEAGSASPPAAGTTLWKAPVTAAHFSAVPPNPRTQHSTPSPPGSNQSSPEDPAFRPLPILRMSSPDRPRMPVHPEYFNSTLAASGALRHPRPQHAPPSKNHPYDIQALHAFQYLSTHAGHGHHSHSPLPASPSSSPEFFENYVQMPPLDYTPEPEYLWHPGAFPG
ncbi:hypothetical protein DFH08DRAFT_102301 [Mycena albidolilacea]|uniref:Zn(2)-C6 fungal-type domain-containing protein n=1 Tax=Mycena albidolilacea TaxID=1033008 RepID=A0AAD6YZ25_9AGAR|nr:hypothetical protein DFH08DRAFT_102301 [Mycena albidolilacea]